MLLYEVLVFGDLPAQRAAVGVEAHDSQSFRVEQPPVVVEGQAALGRLASR